MPGSFSYRRSKKTMMEFISMLVSFFLTGPLQSELSEKLADARAPQAVVSQLSDCARDATPALLDRAISDPWWAATSTFSVWTGMARPESILVQAAPACAPAVAAARPFLNAGS
jgi:hypothetical protein